MGKVLSGYGFTYMNLWWCSHVSKRRSLELSVQITDTMKDTRIYHVKYISQEKWWRQKTFNDRKKAERLYHRMERRYIESKF